MGNHHMLTREVGCTHRLVFLVTNTRTYTRREVLAPPSSYRTRHIRFLETPVLSASFPPLFALYFWRLTTLVPLSSLANPQFCSGFSGWPLLSLRAGVMALAHVQFIDLSCRRFLCCASGSQYRNIHSVELAVMDGYKDLLNPLEAFLCASRPLMFTQHCAQ